MRTRRRGRNPHMVSTLVDTAHVVLCIGIVIFAVVIFMNPEQFKRFFPVVFSLAAAMQLLHGVPKLTAYRRSHGSAKGILISGVVLCLCGAALAALTVISAITVW